jgi:hypothetical protein
MPKLELAVHGPQHGHIAREQLQAQIPLFFLHHKLRPGANRSFTMD